MIKTTLRRFAALTATTALAASLAACGPDDAQQNHAAAPLLSQAALQPGWSMDDLAGIDPAFLGGQSAPLPRAVPMRAAYRGGYDYAPAFDYGPDPYDERYYADDPGADDYQWLALASSLAGMLGSAPPDYAFGYGGVQPWAWETGDRYLRYAEPLDDGYRYYYYEPDSYTPFLVSDPYYSYGYRNDRLVAIYDRSGRVIDARRAERQRQAAQDYYARARQMYLAAHRQPRVGVAAPLWQRHRDDIVRERSQWDQARGQRQAWQSWDAQNEERLHRNWAGEALVRREAERSFAGWQKADFRTPAPKFYSRQQRQAQLQKVAEIRQQQPIARQQTSGRQTIQPQRLAAVEPPQRRDTDALEAGRQQQAEAQRQAQQQQAQAERADARRQVQAQREGLHEQARAQLVNAQRQALAQKQAQQRQADAQRVKVEQAQRQAQAGRAKTQQVEAQAQRAKEQQAQAQRAKTQQQARQAALEQQQAAARDAQQRQQAAHERQLAAQRAAQQQQAQARAAAQVQQRQAAQQKAAQARAAAQQEAVQAHAAAQQQQARQAAQQKAAQARAAAQQEAAQAHAAAQQKAAQAQVAPQTKKPAHGRGRPDRG